MMSETTEQDLLAMETVGHTALDVFGDTDFTVSVVPSMLPGRPPHIELTRRGCTITCSQSTTYPGSAAQTLRADLVALKRITEGVPL